MIKAFRNFGSARVLSGALLLALAGPALAEEDHSGHDSAPAAESHAGGAPHWSYEGEDGPSHWGELPEGKVGAPAFPSCGLGDAQSPIDLGGANAIGLIVPETHYVAGPLVLKPNGHTIEVTAPPGSDMTIGVVVYDLLQVHFHTPSEHTIDGEHAQMEVHFVHQNKATGQLAVLGVLVKPGAANQQLENILHEQSGDDYDHRIGKMTFDPNALLPADLKVYRYDGSLTTPPCSEGVNWNVAATPIEAGQDEIWVFQSKMGVNDRPVQALNARPLVKPD